MKYLLLLSFWKHPCILKYQLHQGEELRRETVETSEPVFAALNSQQSQQFSENQKKFEEEALKKVSELIRL